MVGGIGELHGVGGGGIPPKRKERAWMGHPRSHLGDTGETQGPSTPLRSGRDDRVEIGPRYSSVATTIEKRVSGAVFDPAAAYDNVSIVEDGALAGGDGALRVVEDDLDFVGAGRLDGCWGGLMFVADLDGHMHGLADFVGRDQVHATSGESFRKEIGIVADDHLATVILDLNYVERRASGDTEALALADGEIVHSGVLADDFAVGGDHLASNGFAADFGSVVSLFGEVGVDETLVVSAGDEANFLGVGLFGDDEAVLAREFANFGLGHSAERKQCSAKLLLRKSEEKVSLIFRLIGGTLEQPAADLVVVSDLGVVAGGNLVGSDLAGDDEKLIELEVIVAEAAGDGRASREILFDKGANDIALEALFVVDDVVGDAESFGDAAGVVDVIDGAAAALDGFGHAGVAGETALVPELHGESDEVVAFGAEHGRDGGGVNSSGHGDGDGGGTVHSISRCRVLGARSPHHYLNTNGAEEGACGTTRHEAES